MIMKIKEEDKDLNYWKENCKEDYLHTPISVLRYITELESQVNNGVLDNVSKPLAPKEVKNCMKADLKCGSVCKEHCGASWC